MGLKVEKMTDLITIQESKELKHYHDLQKFPNGIIFFDYENIYRRLQEYGKNIIELNLVEHIKNFFSEKKINILDFMIYANFDEKEFHVSFHQTYLQSLGITTKHTSFKGKNTADIQLVVDAMKMLFKNNLVDVFIVISSDRDMTPLLHGIKQESKLTYLLTTKNGFEKSMMHTADYHEYLENILNLSLDYRHEDPGLSTENIPEQDIEAAKSVVTLLLSSKIWERYIKRGNPIHFEEFKKHISIAKRLLPIEVDRLFKIAQKLDWIKLYRFRRNEEDITGIKGGDKIDEVITSNMFKEQFSQ